MLILFSVRNDDLRDDLGVSSEKKIREKLGGGWVSQAPTRICIFFFFLCVEKMARGVDEWGLTNPSFSRFFLFVLT